VSENILILTPYHDFGEMLRLGLMESETYFPHLTHNSAEALLAASEDKFGLAIIDTEIPGPSFRELWKDLKTMQPGMQLVLIFPEAEDEYPSLDGLAPLGCVDHLLYMPEFLELIDSAFPTIEESISTPAPAQQNPSPINEETAQSAQDEKRNTDWLEDAQIASEHLEKQLPICSAKAAMIARSDKVLAYSDQLEVAAAQEIANRFTRYWDKDGKNSDLVRFIHLGPMNNAFLLYVTDLANEAVLAAIYDSDTPLSQPHREISKLARILLKDAPIRPQNGTGSLKMEFIDDKSDVFSQRMRMVTGSLRPLATGTKEEEPVEEKIVEQEEIEEAGGRAITSKFDVSDFDAVHEGIDKIIEKFGGLHILINNAGITRDTLLMRMKEEDWDNVISINLKGIFNCTKAVTRNMFKQREGRIINLTSVVGEMGNAGQTNYAASKAGIIGFTKACAREMAPRGITVNAVSPGFIKTDITDELPEDIKKEYISRIPLNRFGTPEDVAGAVAFLTSGDASYITGEVFRINGGIYT